MDNFSLNWDAECSRQINRRNEIMMAVQHIVMTAPQFSTQGTHKSDFIANRNWRMDDPSAKRLCLFIQLAWLPEITIKCPIKRNAVRPTKSKHPDKPIFYGTSIEILHDVQDFLGD